MAQVHEAPRSDPEPGLRVLNPPRPPLWRSPRYLRHQHQRAKTRPVLMALSSACAVCLVFPDRFDFRSAISFQLAQGSITARLLFGLMFATLIYVAVRLWTWRRYAGAALATLAVALLAVIAATDPRSALHNGVFVGLTGGLITGHAIAWQFGADGRLLLTGLGCVAGAILCPFSLGMAERLIIVSSCLTLNVVILEYFD